MKKRKIVYIVFGALFLCLCIAFLIQTIYLHNVEVAAQIEKIGYYKQDVYLNYARYVKIICGTVSSVVALFFGAFLLITGIWEIK